MFHANLQPIIPTGSGEEVDFVVLASFSNGSRLDLTIYAIPHTVR